MSREEIAASRVSFLRDLPGRQKSRYRWLRQAGFVLCFILISVVPGAANVEILWLRVPMFVEVAKMAVSRQIESPIQKTSLYHHKLISISEILINKVIKGLSIEIVIPKASRWIDYTATLPFISGLTGIHRIEKPSVNGPIGIFLRSDQECVDRISEPESWFATSVLIFDRNFDRLSNSRFGRDTGVVGANPCALSFDQRFIGIFGLLSRCIRSDFGSIGLISYWPVGHSHFIQLTAENISLIENAGRSGHDKDKRKVFPKTPSAIIAAFFFAIGLSLPAYGVYKSREIGGWAALIVAVGFPPFFAGVFFLLSGVLGLGGGIRCLWF
jgi:hypothetical protein